MSLSVPTCKGSHWASLPFPRNIDLYSLRVKSYSRGGELDAASVSFFVGGKILVDAYVHCALAQLMVPPGSPTFKKSIPFFINMLVVPSNLLTCIIFTVPSY